MKTGTLRRLRCIHEPARVPVFRAARLGIRGGPETRMLNVAEDRPNLKALLDSYERQLIETALVATHGNQRRAAATLGLLPTTLHEKMKRLGLIRSRSEPVSRAS